MGEVSKTMETLLIERSGGVVTVVMNRPEKKNAMNGIMFDELTQIFREVEHNEDDRCLVLTGAGGEFCTGADLTDPRGAMDPSTPGIIRMRRLNETALALYELSKPTIAKVDGLAVGAGMSLAIGCDLVVASERARFSMIFTSRGLSPDLGSSWLLPRLIGLAQARELVLLAEMTSAERGKELGFVNRVVPLETLEEVVATLATQLATGPSIALGLAKSLLNQTFQTSMAQALEDEGRAQAVNFGTEDLGEAIRAFMGKRPPVFKGR